MTSQTTGDLATTLARNIRSARGRATMTQREFAAALDVDSGMVSKWERGKHAPTQENLAAIAHLAGVSIAWLYTVHTAATARDTFRQWAGDAELPEAA